MTWYITRNPNGTIASINRVNMLGYNDEILADGAAEIVAFIAAAQSPPPKPSPREWLERLSPTTQLALETAALSSAVVSLWLRKATGTSTGIDVNLQETKDGVAAMVAAGLITTAEQTTLLAP